jgi:tRNA/tmRNA/rRNA uracil-C5-methylase (TrmA/RlmC/RlmD family)
VNIPVFECIARDIVQFVATLDAGHRKTVLDMYAGVGTLGLLVASEFKSVFGVELFESSREYARKNAEVNTINNLEFEVGSASQLLEHIPHKECIIVDPPRSGLELSVTNYLTEHGGTYIIYLSCNPYTQKRDMDVLSSSYFPVISHVYNMYPQTPHMESLIILERKP